MNWNVSVFGLYMETPVMSEGSRSGVNWILLKLHPTLFAMLFASIVFPTPGTSSINMCPLHIKEISARRTAAVFPTMTFSTFSWILRAISKGSVKAKASSKTTPYSISPQTPCSNSPLSPVGATGWCPPSYPRKGKPSWLPWEGGAAHPEHNRRVKWILGVVPRYRIRSTHLRFAQMGAPILFSPSSLKALRCRRYAFGGREGD